MVLDLNGADRVRADVHGGINIKALQLVMIRAGYYGDRGFKDNYVTWGLGVEIPTARVKIKVDYAMRIEVCPMDEPIRLEKPEANSRIWNTIGFGFGF